MPLTSTSLGRPRCAASAALLLALQPALARADSVRDRCVASYERAQVLRQKAELRQSRKELLVCAQAACPAATRADCEPWLVEVEHAIPTIVVSLKDASGNERTDVAVSADGELLASRLDGRPVPVDPGPHTLRFEAPGQPAVTESVVIHEGEKDRLLRFDVPWEGSPVAPKAESPSSPSSSVWHRRPSPWVFVLGGVGVLATGTFAYFGLKGRSDSLDVQHQGCLPNCPTGEVASANHELLAADVSLGIAVVALGVATWLFLSGTGAAPASSSFARSAQLVF